MCTMTNRKRVPPVTAITIFLPIVASQNLEAALATVALIVVLPRARRAHLLAGM